MDYTHASETASAKHKNRTKPMAKPKVTMTSKFKKEEKVKEKNATVGNSEYAQIPEITTLIGSAQVSSANESQQRSSRKRVFHLQNLNRDLQISKIATIEIKSPHSPLDKQGSRSISSTGENSVKNQSPSIKPKY